MNDYLFYLFIAIIGYLIVSNDYEKKKQIEKNAVVQNKTIEQINNLGKIPKGWIVYEAGQSPLHLLWFVHLVNLEDLINKSETPRAVYVEDKNSFNDALVSAVSSIA